MNVKTRRLVRELERKGWTVRRAGGHVVMYAPDGESIVTLPGTPSDPRAMKNVRSEIRRIERKARR